MIVGLISLMFVFVVMVLYCGYSCVVVLGVRLVWFVRLGLLSSSRYLMLGLVVRYVLMFVVVKLCYSIGMKFMLKWLV